MAPKKENKILKFLGGLLRGGSSDDADENINLEHVYDVTKKFRKSMGEFLDTEYEYIEYLRNRNGGGFGVGLDGERGSTSITDYSRDKRRARPRPGNYVPFLRRPPTKPQTRAQFMKNRLRRLTDKKLMNKFGLTKSQIDVYRRARANNQNVKQALEIARKSSKGSNIIFRQFDKLAANIPNRPLWATKHARWPGMVVDKAKRIIPKVEVPKLLKNIDPRKINIQNLYQKLPKPVRNNGGKLLLGALSYLDYKNKRTNENKRVDRALAETAVTTACGWKGFALGSSATLSVSGPLLAAPTGYSQVLGGLLWLGGGIAGAWACDKAGQKVVDYTYEQLDPENKGFEKGGPNNPTNKNKFGSLVGGRSGGSVINSPTRGMLGGSKALVGEAQEAEVILPMSKIGDALAAVYREGASVMVGATISFLSPLSGSSAVASVLKEAKKLQSIVGTSDIQAETPKVPEIQQVDVKASNTETTNIEQKLNSGGFVSGPSGIDKVPARLTAGEFVMSKGAVKKFGASTLASMNAAGGGTNRPTVSGGFNEGGKVQTMSEKLGHTRGVLTDKEEKARIEAETLYWVNKERTEILGLPPLDKITYAEGVELTKAMGAEYYGGGIKETSHTDMDFNTMTKSTWEQKTKGAETIFRGSMGVLTEEDKQAYLASNPEARFALELKEQLELDALSADISASAKMNGGGLVQGFNGGGLVGPSPSKSSMSPNIKPSPKKNVENINQTPVLQTKKAMVKSVVVPVPEYIPQLVTKTVEKEVPIAKLSSLIISDQGKGVRLS